jgi:hypothetical protein
MDRKPIVACGPSPLNIVGKIEPLLSPHLVGVKVSVYEPVYARAMYGQKLCRTREELLRLFPHEEPDPRFTCKEEPWKEAILLGISRTDLGGTIFYDTQRVKNNRYCRVREHKWIEMRFGPHDQSSPPHPLHIQKVKMDDGLQVFALANKDSDYASANRYGGHTVASFMRYPHNQKSPAPKTIVRVKATVPFSACAKTRVSILNSGETCVPVSSKKE